MSLMPIRTIQECSKCHKHFIYESNTMDIPLEVKCDECNFLFFKGYEGNQWFMLSDDLKGDELIAEFEKIFPIIPQSVVDEMEDE